MMRRVDDVDVGERLGQVVGLAHVVDHLPDRPEGRHGHEIRLHETAGRFLGILQVALEGRSLPGRQLRQDLLLFRLIEVFQQIGGIVRFQLGDCFGKNTFRQLVQKLVTHGAVQFGQDVVGKIITQRADELDARIGLQQLDNVGQIGRRQAPREFAGPRRIATGKRLADGPRQLGGGLPILSFVLHAIFFPPEERRARPHASCAADSTARAFAPSPSH